MDRALERRRGPSLRSALVVTACGGVLLLVYVLLMQAASSRLEVDPLRLATAQVARGEFREYYPFDGRVEPVTTVYLDVEEGGRVEEVFVQGGQWIEKGRPILRFSNASLQRSSIDTETRLVQNLDALRNTQFDRAVSALLLKDQLLDLDHNILETEKQYARYSKLVETGGLIEREAYERTRDQLEYLKAKRALLRERIEREAALTEQQLAQADESIKRLNTSLKLLTRIVDSLEVRAPISGYLSNIDAEIGQNINHGTRIGQIDLLDELKITIQVDQYYISRVQAGTLGKVDVDGTSYPVAVEKIYSEVVDGAFRVDVAFADGQPQSLHRGQRLTVELSFGEPTQQLIVAKGGFMQSTGGRWAYLISPDGRSARRTPIRLGRQNPRFVEVLDGLRPGDRIVASSYDVFNDADELRFTQPIQAIDGRRAAADAPRDARAGTP